jgi:hypothetical protein
MKDVSDIIAQRLQKLKKGFSPAWVSDFRPFIQFLQTNPITAPITKALAEEKARDHKVLVQSLEQLLVDGRQSLQQILKVLKVFPDLLGTVKPKAESISRLQVDIDKLADPFFDLEAFFWSYYREWVDIIKKIAEDDQHCFIWRYAVLRCIKMQDTINIEVDLSFSKHLSACKRALSTLSAKRAVSIWGQWDLMLKWMERTKGGISNKRLVSYLSGLFNGEETKSAVESIGCYFREKLADAQTAPDSWLHAIELFLDAKDRFWIIAHMKGKGATTEPFFIKKLQNGSRQHRLLTLLLQTSPGSTVTFNRLSHALGELEINKGLEKAFFSYGHFAGHYVDHESFEPSITGGAILTRLRATERSKKNCPWFDYNDYYSSKS